MSFWVSNRKSITNLIKPLPNSTMGMLDQEYLLLGIATVFASLISLVLRHYKHTSKTKLVPEAGGGWPIVGHLPLLAGSKLPHHVFASMADKYGPIFMIRLSVKKALVISSPELARECLVTNDKAVTGRPKSVGSDLLSYNYALFGSGPYSSYWRYMRKVVMVELLSNHRLNMLSHVWNSEVKMFINKLQEEWSTKKTSSNFMLVDMKQLFGDLAMTIIVRIISGKKFVGDSEEAFQFKEAIRGFFELVGSFAVADSLPYLRWLDLGGQEKAMRKTFKQLDHIIQAWLEEHKQKRSMDETKVDRDFMDVMLSVIDNEAAKYCNYDADTINKATCLSMILGGSDTTTVTLTWAISLLLNNHHVLEIVKEELDTQVGKERQMSESDIPNLVYLQAVVKETMRLYPPAPLAGVREFSEDCTIDGYYVPAGTRLVTNLSKICRDPHIWEDPLEFRPERFLTTHKNVDVRGQHSELFPFGAGRRMCPGMYFGLQVVHLALASFLHAFQVSTLSKDPIDMTEGFGMTMMKATALEVLIAPSLSATAYANYE